MRPPPSSCGALLHMLAWTPGLRFGSHKSQLRRQAAANASAALRPALRAWAQHGAAKVHSMPGHVQPGVPPLPPHALPRMWHTLAGCWHGAACTRASGPPWATRLEAVAAPAGARRRHGPHCGRPEPLPCSIAHPVAATRLVKLSSSRHADAGLTFCSSGAQQPPGSALKVESRSRCGSAAASRFDCWRHMGCARPGQQSAAAPGVSLLASRAAAPQPPPQRTLAAQQVGLIVGRQLQCPPAHACLPARPPAPCPLPAAGGAQGVAHRGGDGVRRQRQRR